MPVVDGESRQSRKRAGSAVSAGRFPRRYDRDERGDQDLAEGGAFDDIERVKASRAVRAAGGKMRNRRYVQRLRSVLKLYTRTSGMTRAFRNIPR